jgi:hypothetical protein
LISSCARDYFTRPALAAPRRGLCPHEHRL